MAVFIGIKMPDGVSEALAPIGERIAGELGGKPTRACNFHMTLHFLGDVPERLPVRCAMESAVQQFHDTFSLTLSGIGTFRRKNREIYWAGVRESEPLVHLRHILGEQLAKEGILTENIPFRPHITLCRNAHVGSPGLPEIPPIAFPVDRITLFSSEHTDDGVFYREIFQKELRL